MPKIEINQVWCSGCYICIEFCPKKVFTKDKKIGPKGFHPVIPARPGQCNLCLECELLCPDLAITVWPKEK